MGVIASETRFRTAFAATPLPLALVDGDGRWVAVTQQLCEQLGATRDELLGDARRAHPLPTTKAWLASSDGAPPSALWVFDVP